LTPADHLYLLGDLCDFWMGARASRAELMRSSSLQALAAFGREGGALAIMPGNHDAWLCPFYEHELGARIISEPFDLLIHGLRLRLVHGHLLGARRLWKSWMESRPFFTGFGRVPEPIARLLDRALTWRNEYGLLAEEERHLRVFRAYVAKCAEDVDLVMIGHVHRSVDDGATRPRMIVLGGWQCRSSFLLVDAKGAEFHVEPDRECEPGTAAASLQPSLEHGARLDEN
jgi:UDP-2,3-diacylglucosamine hydrolase